MHISRTDMMKSQFIKLLFAAAFMAISLSAFPQVESAGEVHRRSSKQTASKEPATEMSQKMRNSLETSGAHDADLSYMRKIYRQLDLTKAANASLYFPEDVIDGKENLFRIIFGRVIDGAVPAYEYLDGKEIFSDQYKLNVSDILTRFDIYATEAKGSTPSNPRYTVEEADVPAQQVLNYYIIEKWEFDTRSNRMKTIVEAICPVLTRSGDFGDETRFPMFWVRMDSLRPYLANSMVSASDDNNLERYSLNDYFSLGLYDGEIYKFQNTRNLSMAQMFPDEDMRKQAQDSIDNRLRTYGKNLWVPTREEYLAMKEKEENAVNTASDSIPERTVVSADGEKDVKATSSRSKKRSSTQKTKATTTGKSGSSRANRKSKVGKSSANTTAEKSVRRRKR